MAYVNLKVETPTVPNFLNVEGLEEGSIIDVALVPEGVLRELGEEWINQLIENAKERADENSGSQEDGGT